MRRVAITGLGVICALGNQSGEFWQALAAGRSGICPIQQLDVSRLRFRNGAEVRDYNPAIFFPNGSGDAFDRFAQFAVIAAREAVRNSGLELKPIAEHTAIVTGSCMGGQSSQDAGFVEIYSKQRERVHPLTIPRTMANAGASQVATEFGITGPVYTISTACSSSNHALGQAFWMVRNGQVEAALAGGSEATFSFGILRAWEALRVVSPDTCRPFARDRKGMILGEGAAMLVLEPLEAARARGAHVYAEIVGFGMSSDASHITRPDVAGAVRAMRGALLDAKIAPTDIGYINAHGTGTAANDVSECAAIRTLFGAHAEKLAVSSTKSMHGHTLGAAGAVEAAATVLALHHGVLPPTANFTEPDPECALDVIPNIARTLQVEHALSNSFAFGGLNAVLAFRAGR